MNAASRKFSQPTLLDTGNVISSRGEAVGVLHYALRECPTITNAGQDRARVSRGRMRTSGKVAAKAKPTSGICGRNGTGSSASAALQKSMESKFLVLSGKDGSTKCSVDLKQKTTPAGRLYSELRISVPTTSEGDSTLWPTPAARDGKDISRSNAFLSQRLRHSPSMATRWLTLGRPWQVISAVYCLAMGYPSSWNEVRLRSTAMQSVRKRPRPSSKRIRKQPAKADK